MLGARLRRETAPQFGIYPPSRQVFDLDSGGPPRPDALRRAVPARKSCVQQAFDATLLCCRPDGRRGLPLWPLPMPSGPGRAGRQLFAGVVGPCMVP